MSIVVSDSQMTSERDILWIKVLRNISRIRSPCTKYFIVTSISPIAAPPMMELILGQ